MHTINHDLMMIGKSVQIADPNLFSLTLKSYPKLYQCFNTERKGNKVPGYIEIGSLVIGLLQDRQAKEIAATDEEL